REWTPSADLQLGDQPRGKAHVDFMLWLVIALYKELTIVRRISQRAIHFAQAHDAESVLSEVFDRRCRAVQSLRRPYFFAADCHHLCSQALLRTNRCYASADKKWLKGSLKIRKSRSANC